MKVNAQELWGQVFGVKDPDSVLNSIDGMIESEDYVSRVEGFMDAVEDVLGNRLKGKEISDMAKALLAYAESLE